MVEGWMFSSTIRNTQKYAVTTYTDIVLESLDSVIWQEENIKSIHVRKEELKLSSFSGDIIIYRDNLMKLTKNNILVIKVAEYRSKQKSELYFWILWINNQIKKKINSIKI